jgi:Ca2+-binding RTX toxin-like protein
MQRELLEDGAILLSPAWYRRVDRPYDERALEGGNGHDALTGHLGDDTLSGAMGNDTLYGGDGDDILDGDAGGNVLHGSTECDTYIYTAGADDYISWHICRRRPR